MGDEKSGLSAHRLIKAKDDLESARILFDTPKSSNSSIHPDIKQYLGILPGDIDIDTELLDIISKKHN